MYLIYLASYTDRKISRVYIQTGLHSVSQFEPCDDGFRLFLACRLGLLVYKLLLKTNDQVDTLLIYKIKSTVFLQINPPAVILLECGFVLLYPPGMPI